MDYFPSIFDADPWIIIVVIVVVACLHMLAFIISWEKSNDICPLVMRIIYTCGHVVLWDAYAIMVIVFALMAIISFVGLP